MERLRYIGRSEATDYRTIDGNYARAVIGYCQYYKGYVTAKQAKVHRCHLKHGGVCPRLQNLEGRSIRKVKTEQFYDKIVSRLDNLIGAVNKLTRTLEAMEKAEQRASEQVNNYAKEMEDMGP